MIKSSIFHTVLLISFALGFTVLNRTDFVQGMERSDCQAEERVYKGRITFTKLNSNYEPPNGWNIMIEDLSTRSNQEICQSFYDFFNSWFCSFKICYRYNECWNEEIKRKLIETIYSSIEIIKKQNDEYAKELKAYVDFQIKELELDQ